MSLKSLIILVGTAVITLAASAHAQYELSGLIGRTFISNQAIKGATFFNNDVRFGNGLTFEINPGRRIYGGDSTITPVTLETPIVINWDEDLNTGANLIPSHFRSYFVAPSARLNIAPQWAVSPWVSFGGGFGYFSESSTLLFGGANPGSTGTATGVVQAGAGFDLKLTRRVAVRFAARDFWSGVPQLNVDTGRTRQHNIFVASGLAWHF